MSEEKEIKEAKSLQERHAGIILADGCPWAEAAERLAMMLGRPAATIAVLLSRQLDLYTHSPQDEAHAAHDEELSSWSLHQSEMINEMTTDQIFSLTTAPISTPSEIPQKEGVDIFQYIQIQDQIYSLIDDYIKKIWDQNNLFWQYYNGLSKSYICSHDTEVTGKFFEFFKEADDYIIQKWHQLLDSKKDVFTAFPGLVDLFHELFLLVGDMYMEKFKETLYIRLFNDCGIRHIY